MLMLRTEKSNATSRNADFRLNNRNTRIYHGTANREGLPVAHCVSAEAEAVLDKEFAVHGAGFVRLVDYLGNDDRVVQAARVSYGEGTKTFREDRGLIHYLMRNEHTSPFEQVMLTYHIKMPIFVARQWVRHRTAHMNEISARYSVLKEEFYVPRPGDVALQSEQNKQGRESTPAPDAVTNRFIDSLRAEQRDAYASYQNHLSANIARELARINLPLSTYTEMYWQIDLHNLFHFLALRLDPHAQKEIRDYAGVVFDLARLVAPVSCGAFEDYSLGAITFSGTELTALKEVLAGRPPDLKGKAMERFQAKLDGKKILS
jgi:thymidylate synthase (FAD)